METFNDFMRRAFSCIAVRDHLAYAHHTQASRRSRRAPWMRTKRCANIHYLHVLCSRSQETGYIMVRHPLFRPSLTHLPSLQARRSIFGFFTRRMYISYLKLSPTGVRKLQDLYLAWCTKKRMPNSYSDHDKSFFTKNSILIFRTSDDNRAYAVSDPLEM